jgi:hypothetical protein
MFGCELQDAMVLPFQTFSNPDRLTTTTTGKKREKSASGQVMKLDAPTRKQLKAQFSVYNVGAQVLDSTSEPRRIGCDRRQARKPRRATRLHFGPQVGSPGNPECSHVPDFMMGIADGSRGLTRDRGVEGSTKQESGFNISSSLTGRYVSPESAVRSKIS